VPIRLGRVLPAFLAVSLAVAAGAEEPRAVATAAKTEVTVGEAFAIDVTATGPEGTAFTFPPGAEAETFELRTAAPPGAAPVPGTHRYEATVFTLGEVEIPPIPVRYRRSDGTEGETATEPIPLKVVSLLPKDPDARKLADLRAPVPVSIGRAFYLAAALALAAVVGLAVWLLRRRRRRKRPETAPPVPELPPDVETLRALDALAASGLLARAEYRRFYIALAATAKRYLERRLSAPVLEMTTTETLAFLRRHRHGSELVPVLRDLSEAADRIKFARGAGGREEAERHLSAVRALVPALEARLQPPPTAEGRAA